VHGPPGVHAAHALQHEPGDVEVDGDLLLLGEHGLLEVELALVHWKTLKTISRTWVCTAHHSSSGESAPISTRTLPPGAAPGERPHRGLVLVGGDLPLAEQHLADAVARQVARGGRRPARP